MTQKDELERIKRNAEIALLIRHPLFAVVVQALGDFGAGFVFCFCFEPFWSCSLLDRFEMISV